MREITGNKCLWTGEKAFSEWNKPKVVWMPRGRQMLVVQRRDTTDVGESLPPLKPVARSA